MSRIELLHHSLPSCQELRILFILYYIIYVFIYFRLVGYIATCTVYIDGDISVWLTTLALMMNTHCFVCQVFHHFLLHLVCWNCLLLITTWPLYCSEMQEETNDTKHAGTKLYAKQKSKLASRATLGGNFLRRIWDHYQSSDLSIRLLWFRSHNPTTWHTLNEGLKLSAHSWYINICTYSIAHLLTVYPYIMS